MITDFCGRFESNFSLAFRRFGLKPIAYSVVKSFDEGVGFSWRAYRNLGADYTCADSTMGLFVDTLGPLPHWLALMKLGSPILLLAMPDGCPT